LLLSRDLDVPESKSSKSKNKKRGLQALLRELSDDEENVTDSPPGISEDPDRPWFQHFSAYINSSEQVPDGWSAIKWWGVRAPSVIL
jgi:hypothetical protein